MQGAASGHYFENHVVIELLKNFSYSSERANLTYYRDSNAKEIDVIVEADGFIHPLEIKKSANPDRREVKKYQVTVERCVQAWSGAAAVSSACARKSSPSTRRTALFRVIFCKGTGHLPSAYATPKVQLDRG